MSSEPRFAARLPLIALLVAASGFSALVYQSTWFRLLRLVFGSSTAASAAVLAIFMGGLGLGSLWLGRRANRSEAPLRLYAHLEIGVALSAALSPFLLDFVRHAYLATGGESALGNGAALLVRLGLGILVMAVPTFLMGGTLPALARAVGTSEDQGRRAVAFLYAANTLGAVLGVWVTSFYAIERLGVRATLWAGTLVNVGAALGALLLSRRGAATRAVDPVDPVEPVTTRETPTAQVSARLVALAAFIVGFAFMLMELVWYRMLAPILGGSVYTFAIVLALALLGIGLGGLLYALGPSSRRPTLGSFAVVAALEALLLGLPFAAGDAPAVLAILLRPLGIAGFAWLTLGWTAVALVVVLPASLVAGYQFPLLIGLIGRGRAEVGREVGIVCACNTGGAILGSLAGGFGALPLLTAPGAWRLSVGMLAALALVTALLAARSGWGASRRAGLAGIACATVAIFSVALPGPSAAWRHSPIGGGRAPRDLSSPNDLERWLNRQRRSILWERDGVESAIAVSKSDSLSLLVHGKSDGNCRYDAPTQVMCGLVGTLLHPGEPRSSLVIGLGSGTSIGWLASVPSMDRVDVVELEPRVTEFAALCAGVNRDALRNPKVHLSYGDGRETLLTTRARYDVILSEPSNPYRSGVASLFTTEFYQAARDRLHPGGVFLQWVQTYGVDAEILDSMFATLSSRFDHVEVWEVHLSGDLLLVASAEPLVHDAARIRARVEAGPYHEALTLAWGVAGLEGFYSGFVAADGFARSRTGDPADALVNSDDRTHLEFGFARHVDQPGTLSPAVRAAAIASGHGRPRGVGGIDWERVAELREARAVYEQGVVVAAAVPTEPEAAARSRARQAYLAGDVGGAIAAWREQSEHPRCRLDALLVAEGAALTGLTVPGFDAERAGVLPEEAAFIRAMAAHARGDDAAAIPDLVAGFEGMRGGPWSMRSLVYRALDGARTMGASNREAGRALYVALSQPFAIWIDEDARLLTRWFLADRVDRTGLCREVLADFEPAVPWERDFLAWRLACYTEHGDPRAARAARELERFLEREPTRFGMR